MKVPPLLWTAFSLESKASPSSRSVRTSSVFACRSLSSFALNTSTNANSMVDSGDRKKKRTFSETGPSKPFTVYHIPICPFSQRMEILCRLKDLKPETSVQFSIVDITKPRDEHILKLSGGTTALPVMELPGHGERGLKESLVLLDFLEDSFPETPIRRQDPYERAIENLMVTFEGKFAASGYILVMNSDKSKREQLTEAYLAEYRKLNDFLVKYSTDDGTPWLFDKFGWAETVFTPFFQRFWFVSYFEGVDLPMNDPDYDRVRQWRDACMAHPAAQQCEHDQIVKLYYDYARGAGNGGLVPGRQVSSFTFDPHWKTRPMVADATKIPLPQLRLIFRGKMIKDDESTQAVAAFKLEPDCVLHCMGKPAETSQASSTTSSTNATATTTTTTSTSTGSTTASFPTVPTAAPAAAPTPAATAAADPLQEALQTLRTSNSPQVYSTAVSTLSKILSNIASHPMEEKYRKVKQQNAAFQKRLGGLAGGDAAMKAVGFVVETQEGVPVYQMHPSPDAWPKLMAAKTTLEAAVTQAQQQQQAPPAFGAANSNPMFGAGGMPTGMPGMPNAAAMNNPMMQSAMTEMMGNPEALRNMLQNPMLQQMIQNDPSVPPHVRDSMQQLASNPAMLDQLANMMRDPSMRSRMQAMMGSAGAGGMPPMGGAPGAPANNNNSTNVNANSNTGGNDQDQTEEDMIAEAIRRSLEES